MKVEEGSVIWKKKKYKKRLNFGYKYKLISFETGFLKYSILETKLEPPAYTDEDDQRIPEDFHAFYWTERQSVNLKRLIGGDRLKCHGPPKLRS
jgi:hypothetical protein